MSEQQIQIFTSEDGQSHLEVTLEQETVWLSQAQMGGLFATTPENVLMHLQNIFKDDELSEQATTKDFLVVRQEVKRQVQREIDHYNLDMIISVGYRVNSPRGVQFRKWATDVLKQYLTQGYTLNQRRHPRRVPALPCDQESPSGRWQQTLRLVSILVVPAPQRRVAGKAPSADDCKSFDH